MIPTVSWNHEVVCSVLWARVLQEKNSSIVHKEYQCCCRIISNPYLDLPTCLKNMICHAYILNGRMGKSYVTYVSCDNIRNFHEWILLKVICIMPIVFDRSTNSCYCTSLEAIFECPNQQNVTSVTLKHCLMYSESLVHRQIFTSITLHTWSKRYRHILQCRCRVSNIEEYDWGKYVDEHVHGHKCVHIVVLCNLSIWYRQKKIQTSIYCKSEGLNYWLKKVMFHVFHSLHLLQYCHLKPIDN